MRCFSFSSFEEKFTRQLRIFFVVSASEPRIQTKTLNQLKSKAPSSPAPPCLSLTAPLPHKEASTSERERERISQRKERTQRVASYFLPHSRTDQAPNRRVAVPRAESGEFRGKRRRTQISHFSQSKRALATRRHTREKKRE